MPDAETVYSARWSGPSIIERNKAQTIAVAIERDGQAPTIASATFTLYKPDGTALSGYDAAVATVSGGTITSPSITAASTVNESLNKDWMCRFDATISSLVYTFYNDAALVRARFYPPIGQTDLVARHHDVAVLRPASLGSLQDYIDQAWADILTRAYTDAVPFWRWRTPSAMRLALLYRTLGVIFRDYSTLLSPGDRYTELADRYLGEDNASGAYEKAYAAMRQKIDVDEDNTLTAEHRPASSVILLQGTRRSTWGGR